MSAIACSLSLCMSIFTCLCVYVCVFLSCTVAFQQLSYFQTKDKTVYQITFDFPSPLLQLSYLIHPQIQTPTQACFFFYHGGDFPLTVELLIFSTSNPQVLPHRNFSGFLFFIKTLFSMLLNSPFPGLNNDFILLLSL